MALELGQVAVILAAIAVFWMRASITAIIAVRGLLTAVGIGALGLRYQAGLGPAFVYSALTLLLVIAASVSTRAFRSEGRTDLGPAIPTAAINTVLVVVTGFIAYHLAVVGLPILSSSIERDRFDIAGSGLLGIPGRMYLFGPAILLALTAANAAAEGVSWRDSKQFRIALGIAASVALVSGFKGSFLNLAVDLIVIQSVVGSRAYRLSSAARRYWLVITFVIGYIIFVASTYSTYAAGGQSLVGRLIDRVTTGGARPTFLMLEHRVPWTGDLFVNDLLYFLPKYIGQDSHVGYPFSRAVSGAIWGVAPESSLWTPPVTISGLGELTFSYGLLAAAIGATMLGVVIGVLESRRFTGVISRCAVVCLQLALLDFVGKGGLVYALLNWGATFTLIFVLIQWAKFTANGVSRPDIVAKPADSRPHPVDSR